MRTHLTVAPGQLWQSSDRRRLTLVRVAYVYQWKPDSDIGQVAVDAVYPPNGHKRELPLRRFLVTGSKGYMRVA